MSRSLMVTAVQLRSLEGLTIDEALVAVEAAVAGAADGGSGLVVLPEIWTPGYFAFDEYEAAAGNAPRIRDHLAGLASRHRIHLHGGSFVEAQGSHLYNTSVLFNPEGVAVAEYRKIHLFGFGSREPEVLTPGDEVVVAETDLGPIGMAVCYDLRFPELFRQMTDAGAEMILVASAWPFPRVDAWQTLARARAIENQVHVVAANGVGPTRSGPRLCGHSMVVDPWGEILAAAKSGHGPATGTIDLDAPAAARSQLRQLADRRVLAPDHPRLVFSRPGERPLVMEVDRVAIAGYTGRDTAAVTRYVEKLKEEGIPAPESVPVVFSVGPDRVVSHDDIRVTGEETCGEVEFVLLVTDEGVHVTVGSDHTDRALEQTSIPLSKQIVPKVVATEAWRLEEVSDHWDRLELSATVGDDQRPYQQTGVDFFLRPSDILDFVEAGPGTVVYGGTVSSLAGGFDFDPVFSGRLHDPVLGRSIEFTYRTRPLEPT
jgi:predicted amidohydrolase